jgi:hypothetical protein
MKITQEQLNEEVNRDLIPYLMDQSIPLRQIIKLVHIYASERLEDYEWDTTDRAMEVVKDEIYKIQHPSFEDRFGPLCLN